MSKVGGQAGLLTYKGNTIYFNSVTPKIERKLADSTDTSSYDPTSDLLWNTQLPVSAKVTIDFEGFFYTDSTDANLLTDLCSKAAPGAAVVKLNSTAIFGHGNVDIMSVETAIVADDVVKIKGQFTSNGVFTHGS